MQIFGVLIQDKSDIKGKWSKRNCLVKSYLKVDRVGRDQRRETLVGLRSHCTALATSGNPTGWLWLSGVSD